MTTVSRIRAVRRAALAAAATLVMLAPQAHAQRAWNAFLSPEVAGATGSGYTYLSLTDKLLTISSSWSGLSGTTTVAHIHCCTAQPRTGTAAVAVSSPTLPGFPVGVTFGTYDAVIDLSFASSFAAGFITSFGGGTVDGAFAALVAGLDNGTAYFNIHSTSFRGGEIRGFTTVVPEPASVVLMGAGLLALAAPVARRRMLGRDKNV